MEVQWPVVLDMIEYNKGMETKALASKYGVGTASRPDSSNVLM